MSSKKTAQEMKAAKEAEEERRKLTFGSIGDIWRNAKRLCKLYWSWKETRMIFLGFFGSALVFAIFPFIDSGLNGLLLNELTEIFGLGKLTSSLVVIIVAIVVVKLIRPTLNNFHNYLSSLFRIHSREKFTLWTLEKYGEMDIATHEDPKMNDLFERVSGSGMGRVRQFMHFVRASSQDFLRVLFASAVIISIEWKLLVLILIATAPRLVVQAKYGLDFWNLEKEKAETSRTMHQYRQHLERIPSLTEVKIIDSAKKFLANIKSLYWEKEGPMKIIERKQMWRQVATTVLSQAAILFATVWMILLVVDGDIQIGTMTFYVASASLLSSALQELFGTLGWLHNDSLFVSDFFELVDTPPAVDKPKQGVKLDKGETPEIVFENVDFKYPGTDKLVLENFNLIIKPGDKVALVGVNGAGKTTFVKLLSRFYDPTEGRILVGGHDLKEIDLKSWYSHIGALFQDYAKYHFTVKDAISVTSSVEGTMLDKVKESAKAAEADIFIEEWEKDYDQMLGREFTEGVEPSIGQWQKLALARTFYRDPRVLILDEPTSAVDAEAEAKIFEKLESLPSDRTVFLISHRFSTVRHADKIVVIDGGKISEAGTHEELLKKNGIYARLFNLQAKGYK